MNKVLLLSLTTLCMNFTVKSADCITNTALLLSLNSLTPISCDGSRPDAAITVFADGIPPFVFQLDDNLPLPPNDNPRVSFVVDPTLDNFHTVFATDGSQQTKQLTIKVGPSAFDGIGSTFIGILAPCNNEKNGSINGIIVGGDNPVTITLRNIDTGEVKETTRDNQNIYSFTDLDAANYEMTYTSTNPPANCPPISYLFELPTVQPIEITATSTPDNGSSNGTITICSSGGISPLYRVTGPVTILQSSNVFKNLPAGTYIAVSGNKINVAGECSDISNEIELIVATSSTNSLQNFIHKKYCNKTTS